MTNEKARDFFSAYYEGSLEAGLNLSMEQRLKADPELSAEYASFVETLDHLGTLKFEEIAIPADLNEKIAARLDRFVYEEKRNAKPALTLWLRNFGFAAVAAAAIAGAVISLRGRGDTAKAGLAPDLAAASDHISYDVSNDGVKVHFVPGTAKTVVITDEQGKERSREAIGDAAHPEMLSVLANDRASATIFEIRGATDPVGSYIAIPGKVHSTINAGEGTTVALAKALSDYYRIPVTLRVNQPNATVSWTFSSADSVAEASKSLGAAYRVTLLQSNILQIEQN